MNKQKLKKWLGISLLMWLTIAIVNPKEAKAEMPLGVSFQVFYDQLSPYGDWVEDPRYGYIWLPYVDQNFHPYGTNGHWVMTEYGNTWVSNYSWGWAPFHYGRWMWDDYYGWAWVPGYEWAPAWVSWRNGGGYYGWAPLGPGVSVSVSIGIPSFHWVFVPHRRFTHRNVYRYCAPRRNVVNIYNRTTIINNTVIYNNHRYIGGPNKHHIERYSRSRVPVYRVSSSRNPGRTHINKNVVNVYKPQVRSASGNSRYNGKPNKVTSRQNARVNRTQYSRGNSSSRNNGGYSNSRTYRSSNGKPKVSPSSSNRGSSAVRSGNIHSSKPKTVKATPYPNNRTNNQVRSSRNAQVSKGNPYSGRTKASKPSTTTSKSRSSKVSSPSNSNRQVRTQPNNSTYRSRTSASKSTQVKRSSSTKSSSRSANTSASTRRSSSNGRARSNN